MRKFLLGTAFFCGVALAGAAQAAVADFNDLAPYSFYSGPLTHGGLTFSNPGDGNTEFAFSTDVIDGSVALLPTFFDSVTTVTAASGGLFTLESFDFADPFDFADDPIALTLTFYTPGGSFSETRFADSTPGLQTETFHYGNLLAFDLAASDSMWGENTFLIDNIRYSEGETPSTVPEPALWGMMVAGFGLIGIRARRRQRYRNARHRTA